MIALNIEKVVIASRTLILNVCCRKFIASNRSWLECYALFTFNGLNSFFCSHQNIMFMKSWKNYYISYSVENDKLRRLHLYYCIGKSFSTMFNCYIKSRNKISMILLSSYKASFAFWSFRVEVHLMAEQLNCHLLAYFLRPDWPIITTV